MIHPGASIHLESSYFPQSLSQSKSHPSLSISTHHATPANETLLKAFLLCQKKSSPSENSTADKKRISSPMTCTTRPPKRLRLIEAIDKPSQPPTLQSTSSHGDNSYLPSLKPSPLRPHCATNERIQKWKPVTSRTTHDQQGKPTNLSKNDLL